MPVASISKTVVDNAQPREDKKDYFIWDKNVSGFGLKVTSAGGKIYVFQYRMDCAGVASSTAPERHRIGKHGNITPEQARVEAKKLAALVAEGKNPKNEKAEKAKRADAEKEEKSARAKLENDLAFSRLADDWLHYYENEKRRRASSVSQAKMVVRNHLKPVLGSTPSPHITRADMQRVIDNIPLRQRAMRRNVFAYSSVLFGWMRRRDYIKHNPIEFIDKPEAPASRDRVLNEIELGAVWKATYSLATPFGPFVRLLILTIQRRGEVSAMNWLELNRKASEWVIPAERAKNGVAHIVPLTEHVIAELDALAGGVDWPKAGYVLTTTNRSPISGISKAKRALDRKVADDIDMPAWRLHDLRRTGATRLQQQGERFEVTEAILNHVSGAKSGVAGVYQRHDWKSEKKTALDSYAAGLNKLFEKNAI